MPRVLFWSDEISLSMLKTKMNRRWIVYALVSGLFLGGSLSPCSCDLLESEAGGCCQSGNPSESAWCSQQSVEPTTCCLASRKACKNRSHKDRSDSCCGSRCECSPLMCKCGKEDQEGEKATSPVKTGNFSVQELSTLLLCLQTPCSMFTDSPTSYLFEEKCVVSGGTPLYLAVLSLRC